MRVDVLATNAGQPVHTRFTFDVPLEDTRLLWLQATAAGLRRLNLPPVGNALRLPPPSPPGLERLEPQRDP
jgi:hypothetical protein